MAHSHTEHQPHTAHKHSHGHGHSHNHAHAASTRLLLIALALVFGFATFEVICGYFANSLTLLSDAGHMAADGLSLALAAVASWVASKPPSNMHSYGMGRAEVLGAWISSLVIVVVVIFIAFEAIDRLHAPQAVSGKTVMFVAIVGIIINLLLAFILTRGEKNLNIHAALLHVFGDLLGTTAALVTGIVVYFTGWMAIDPMLSIFVCILLLISSFRLLRETLLILMEGVPLHLDLAEVGQQMAKIAKVRAVHDLHIWTLSSGVIVLTAHVEVDEMQYWEQVLLELRRLLTEEFSIHHVTLQPEYHTQILQPMIYEKPPLH